MIDKLAVVPPDTARKKPTPHVSRRLQTAQTQPDMVQYISLKTLQWRTAVVFNSVHIFSGWLLSDWAAGHGQPMQDTSPPTGCKEFDGKFDFLVSRYLSELCRWSQTLPSCGCLIKWYLVSPHLLDQGGLLPPRHPGLPPRLPGPWPVATKWSQWYELWGLRLFGYGYTWSPTLVTGNSLTGPLKYNPLSYIFPFQLFSLDHCCPVRKVCKRLHTLHFQTYMFWVKVGWNPTSIRKVYLLTCFKAPASTSVSPFP